MTGNFDVESAAKYGYAQGCFNAPEHAQNAARKFLREQTGSLSSSILTQLWKEEVAKRVSVKQSKQIS